ncbi:hypothetical protein D3C78_1384890 [compost metagenome]
MHVQHIGYGLYGNIARQIGNDIFLSFLHCGGLRCPRFILGANPENMEHTGRPLLQLLYGLRRLQLLSPDVVRPNQLRKAVSSFMRNIGEGGEDGEEGFRQLL